MFRQRVAGSAILGLGPPSNPNGLTGWLEATLVFADSAVLGVLDGAFASFGIVIDRSGGSRISGRAWFHDTIFHGLSSYSRGRWA